MCASEHLSKVKGHLPLLGNKAALFIEGDSIICAIQYNLITALFPSEIYQSLNNLLAELQASSVLIDDDILDVGAYGAAAYELVFHEDGAGGDDSAVRAHGNEGVAHSEATLLLHEGGEGGRGQGGGGGELRENGEETVRAVDGLDRTDRRLGHVVATGQTQGSKRIGGERGSVGTEGHAVAGCRKTLDLSGVELRPELQRRELVLLYWANERICDMIKVVRREANLGDGRAEDLQHTCDVDRCSTRLIVVDLFLRDDDWAVSLEVWTDSIKKTESRYIDRGLQITFLTLFFIFIVSLPTCPPEKFA